MLAVEDAGDLLGVTACGASRDADADERVGEVRMIFAAQTAWGRGVGPALMAAALDDLRERGYAEATVWSFAGNQRANRFYESSGFSPDGATRTQGEWADIPQVRYRRSL